MEDPVADAVFSDVEVDVLLDPVDEGQLVGGQTGRGPAERAVVGITLVERVEGLRLAGPSEVDVVDDGRVRAGIRAGSVHHEDGPATAAVAPPASSLNDSLWVSAAVQL